MASVTEIRDLCKQAATKAEACELQALFGNDERSGVRASLASMSRRIAKDEAERQRVIGLYEYEQELKDAAGCSLSVGLDEVGRGPLAGPVAIGAVAYDARSEPVWGINDSKKLSEAKRRELAEQIRERALACDVVFVPASEIDEIGIAGALRKAFLAGIASVERQLRELGREEELGLVVLDGNPMHLDEREVNVVKGDAKVASISSASIIAKVARDAYMEQVDATYPEYGFVGHKGYGAASHIDAIRQYGLCPEHRASFCRNFAD